MVCRVCGSPHSASIYCCQGLQLYLGSWQCNSDSLPTKMRGPQAPGLVTYKGGPNMNRLGQELQELVQYHRRFYQIECEESIALLRVTRASSRRPTTPFLFRL